MLIQRTKVPRLWKRITLIPITLLALVRRTRRITVREPMVVIPPTLSRMVSKKWIRRLKDL
jgi:hypothetical protein